MAVHGCRERMIANDSRKGCNGEKSTKEDMLTKEQSKVDQKELRNSSAQRQVRGMQSVEG